MAQILRFFGWIAWGVVTTIIIIGALTAILFEGASSLGDAFNDPATTVILLVAYIPGGILYLLGSVVDWIKAREDAAKSALEEKPLNKNS